MKNAEHTVILVLFYIALVLGLVILHTNDKGFTDCIHYKVGGNYTWGDTGKMIVYQAGDNVCYRINKNGLQDIYIAE